MMRMEEQIISKLEEDIRQLDASDRQWLSLRLEFLLIQMEAALKSQRKLVIEVESYPFLSKTLSEAISSVEKFREWFAKVIGQKSQLTLERYLSAKVAPDAKHVDRAIEVLERMMFLLPRWLNVECTGQYSNYFMFELNEGYRVSMTHGTLERCFPCPHLFRYSKYQRMHSYT